MKKDYLSYYINVCRSFKFYTNLIMYKLKHKLPLTREEEEILCFLDDYYYLITNIERIVCDE